MERALSPADSEPGLVRVHDQLGAIPALELGQQATHVGPDGAVAEEEPSGDLLQTQARWVFGQRVGQLTVPRRDLSRSLDPNSHTIVE